jgi:hypothetical protein
MTTSSLFTSRPIPHGGTFTLTTWFGKMLSEAEELYGRRDMDWTPIGVEFFDCEKPHIWFPGSRKYVCVRLTLHSLDDLDQALWQLAQEIGHCLAPTRNANNLGEGLATHFALNVGHYSDKSRLAGWRAMMEHPSIGPRRYPTA